MKLITCRLSFGNSENPFLQHVHLLRQIGERSKAYSEVMIEPFLDNSLISVCKCMITKYKVDNYHTLYIVVSRGFMEIILKSSILEASTRTRTGDSAETIKLFENTFFFSNEQNSQHNKYG